jgi:RNA polymerase sigma factor (sigma-70 family)
MIKEIIGDELIWKRFKEGDSVAFNALYDKYVDNLYRYGSHFSKDKDLIIDCIHDLFLDLYKYRKKLSETNNVQFYLFRSLRRIIYKSQNRLIRVMDKEWINFMEDNAIFSHEDYLIADETKIEDFAALNKAMKTLTNRQREGLSLKFEHNHSYSEISEIMGVSIESARSIIYLALKELRKSIEAKGHKVQLLFFLIRNSHLQSAKYQTLNKYIKKS